jgi:hypothetical protein
MAHRLGPAHTDVAWTVVVQSVRRGPAELALFMISSGIGAVTMRKLGSLGAAVVPPSVLDDSFGAACWDELSCIVSLYTMRSTTRRQWPPRS